MSAHTIKAQSRVSTTTAVLLAGATLMAAIALEATMARASDLVVRYDQSQLLRLPRPAAEIIIGNPTIADVSVQGGNLLVITGKSFGITNIIALDGERNVIQDQRVVVQRDEFKAVSLVKGIKRETYSCDQQCNPTVTVGDDTAHFEAVVKTAEKKIKFSESGGDGGGGGGGGGGAQ